ncbi:MAG: hypothetical protein AVDCRST_MAG29-180, partial [uncultured Nocardioidaceae bacterium]
VHPRHPLRPLLDARAPGRRVGARRGGVRRRRTRLAGLGRVEREPDTRDRHHHRLRRRVRRPDRRPAGGHPPHRRGGALRAVRPGVRPRHRRRDHRRTPRRRHRHRGGHSLDQDRTAGVHRRAARVRRRQSV